MTGRKVLMVEGGDDYVSDLKKCPKHRRKRKAFAGQILYRSQHHLLRSL